MRTLVYNGVTLKVSGPSIVEIIDGQLHVHDDAPVVTLKGVTSGRKKKIKAPVDVSVRGTCSRIIRELFTKSGDTEQLLTKSEHAVRSAFNSHKVGCSMTLLHKNKDGLMLYEVTRK
jgi:hypothetical protein